MLKRKVSSINFKTLLYLVIFSITILLLLLLSQNILLKFSYEHYQENKMGEIVRNIRKFSSDELVTELEGVAYDNGVCIQYSLTSGDKILYNTLMVGCGLNKNNSQITNLINDIMESGKTTSNIKLINSVSETKALLSGVEVQDGYVFIYSNLEDLDGANIVLRGQLIYITIIVIVLACFISYFLSIKITKPITNITKKAKELGEGRYDTHFERSDVLEIDELANTLNHVGKDLSKIDELRRDLMANVSHDLKTPLTMIKAYAEMIRDISYKDHGKMNEHLGIIVDETDRLTVLVNDILDLSKMQSNADTLKLEKFNLAEEINSIVKRYQIIKETEQYTINVEMPEEIWIKADKKKINQVIYNLVNNAINYTGDDKTVTIRVTKHKKYYLVEIIDTGKGIKPEEIPYIWDKYYKNDKKHQRNVVSTGLGLSIVKQILELHNYEYGAKSVLKKGSTFYFKIKL